MRKFEMHPWLPAHVFGWGTKEVDNGIPFSVVINHAAFLIAGLSEYILTSFEYRPDVIFIFQAAFSSNGARLDLERLELQQTLSS